MNIVKGVADLIRRSSVGQNAEFGSASLSERLSSPKPKILFSDSGDEAILSTLWGRCENALDKVEKRKSFHIFLKQFLIVYKNWDPVFSDQSAEDNIHNEVVVGCSVGHPAEVIAVLIEEVTQTTGLITELNTGTVQITRDQKGTSTKLTITSEGLPVLNALGIITRSILNCRVFGFYGGIQKLTALMKAAVIQLKTITGALSADDKLSSLMMEKIIILQQLLLSVLLIVCSFIFLHPDVCEKVHLYSNNLEFSVPRGGATLVNPSVSWKNIISERTLDWHQKAVVSLMEAGGLNWLVELLRVMRRLSMKEQLTNTSMQYWTLEALRSALADNTRGQNHFRSIGGLEVLLDGLGLQSNNVLRLKDSSSSDGERNDSTLVAIFQLHVLSLEVLREAVFGNLSNLQFLCEDGRVHKFANCFCSLAFIFQEHGDLSGDKNIPVSVVNNSEKISDSSHSNRPYSQFTAHSSIQQWSNYSIKLSRVLAAFLIVPDEVESNHFRVSSGRNFSSVSTVYGELSIRWFTRALLMIFPCIRACSNHNELSDRLRIFVCILQHYALFAFRKVLVPSPNLLDIFRAEGVWDLFFSENFFYSKPTTEECAEHYKCDWIPPWYKEICSSFENFDSRIIGGENDILQIEIISFVEFAATLSGTSHNLPECSVLLDALEQSACHPVIAGYIVKSLLQILQLSTEKTYSSLRTLDGIARVLKVACILIEECKQSENWLTSVELSIELFVKYLSATDDAKILVLHSPSCINCLFKLFWEKDLRNNVLGRILELMKITPNSEEDKKAQLHLCSKYLETFTNVKEREMKFAELSINLLVGMREMISSDQLYYQALFRDGECFLHIVSLLNGTLDEEDGEKLVLNVLQTLTCLLKNNDISKASFRALVGKGYKTLQGLLLDFCKWHPSEYLMNALLHMLVDEKFDIKTSPIIKNEDVILLYLSLLRKSSDSLQQYGLNVFLQLLRDSISNRDSCVRAGMLGYLLDWFSHEENDSIILKMAQLIQVTGGHSISGKDIRTMFALLRSEKVGTRQQYYSLLLTSMLSMLNEKGPTAFFDLDGRNSGIMIKTPIQWPLNKGFSFSCWLRIENFPRSGTMGLFSFLSESRRGCLAGLAKDKLVYESINQKRQCVSMQVNLVRKKWHFVCLSHSIGRAFSGGSLLKCYVDGVLASSEKCRYAKVNEVLTSCMIGSKIDLPPFEEENPMSCIKESSPFLGQIGPIYMFNDAITPEQVKGIYSLGPSYMYAFLNNETSICVDIPLPGGVLDPRDGLSSKILFGLNAQASSGRTLYNVSPSMDHVLNKDSFAATVMVGTQLCSRSLLQQIIYCVGGVSVFFPLFTQTELYENEESEKYGQELLTPITKERLTAEVIELIASVLDENLANQQQMLLLSGFSILGFLLQSVPQQQLNLETLSSLKHLFNVVANSGLSELLVKDAISHIFLNPLIWGYTVYKVQRELYMFLIQQFDNDPRLLKSLCRLPRVLDIIIKFYWDNAKCRYVVGGKHLLHPNTKQILAERPDHEEIRKIRLLLLSLGEMSLRQHISVSDIKALISFFETSEDMSCVEDVLHMVIRAVSQKQLLASFLEQVNSLGGCHIFVNLLQRDFESIRLLSLQFLGRLLVGLPSERKGAKFFNISVGRSKSLSEGHRKISLKMQPIFSAISDRLFRFPQTESLCASLFDVLLGGASPKQVLQKHSQQLDMQRSKGNNSHFFLPQILVLIFKFLSQCDEVATRTKIIGDLLELLDSNPSNIEALMEYGWNAWLMACMKLEVLKIYKVESREQCESELSEISFVRNLFCVVLCYYMHSVKGGWLQLEETVNFLLLQREQAGISSQYLLRDIFKDIVQKLIDLSSEENIFVSQPCRDNTLFLLKLLDDNLMSEINFKLPYPTSSLDISADFLEAESNRDLRAVLHEALEKESDESISRDPLKELAPTKNDTTEDEWWILYDNLWIIICQINGKGPSKMLPKSSSSTGPSFGQRARELVESLNIPATEMASVVYAGGLTMGGKANKSVDKAMLLRGEKCHRIVFRLVILYLCRASLSRASRCIQLVIPLLPYILTPEDDQTRSRLQLFIGALLSVRSQFGTLDDGARFYVISHMIRETVNSGKSMLVTSIMGRDESSDSGSSKGPSTLQNIIQKDRVLSAVADEVNYIKLSNTDRQKQLYDLRVRIDENSFIDSNQNKAFEDEVQSSLNTILDWDDSRRVSFKLSNDEEQQIVAEKWLHMFRTLMDERGPWSANSFPNNIATHWKLDKTEDSWRRRPKLRRNYHFDEKLCHPPSSLGTNEAVLPAKEKKSVFGGHIPEQMRQLLLKGIRKITDEGSLELSEIDGESFDGENISERKGSSSNQNDHFQNTRDTTTTLTEQENSEVLMSVPCVLVTPKRKLAGRFAVMMNVLHFFSEFLVEGTCGSTVFNDFQVESREKKLDIDFEKDNASNKSETVRANVLQKQPKNIKCHRRWKIFKIKAVHWTRYLLRYTAVEIFFNDSTAPIFLNFASLKVAKDIGTLIVATRNEYMFPKGSRDKAEIISFIDRRVAAEMAETARESWRRREMTNFQYLMFLNTLAGRSYNDLTQYPVFPWVIADYSSETLDFNTSSTFRDLSKPVGALDPKRLEVFEDRYRNFSDPDIPNFYYGSHYSSMGIVLFYLLRLEPFTALHRSLQGGKFDHADRLFQSIEGTYRNCLSNTSDVKELTPEFFYMPEFLVNSNSYHLGIKQDGEPLTDVCLPPWAKGSPEEFINKNREALESEYVSSNLHHWIDLVFGYKQRGKPAVEAANIFYYLTYEGAVDLDVMEDDLQRSALEDQIANFGQTPIQIFRKKHPRRGPPIPIAHPLHFAPGSISLTSVVNDTNNPPSAIVYVNVIDSNVVLLNQCLALSVKMWITTQLQSGGNFTFSGCQDPIFGIGYDILTSRKIGSPLSESIEPGPQCFAITQTPSENFLISCGNWENSFQVISLTDGRLVQSVRQHKDVVSCVAVISDGTILATGSHDTTVMVWEVLRVRTHEKRVRNTPTDIHRKDYIISETPFHILCGHDDVITCLFVSVELDMVISGSKDGTCIFHSLREGRYIRSIRHPSGFALSKLIASHHGRIVIYSDEDISLNLYSINGKHIAACESNGRLNCVELSSCGEFLVCAGDQGQIIVRTMSSLEIVKRYGGVGKIITSLTVTNEECFLAGTRDGSLLVYSIENPQLRKTSLPRNIKYKGSPVG